MLAVFDSIFITTASVTFSLPLLSNYWQVFIIYLFISIDLNMAIMMMMVTIFRLGSTLISFLGYFRSFKSPSMAQFGQTYEDDVEDGDDDHRHYICDKHKHDDHIYDIHNPGLQCRSPLKDIYQSFILATGYFVIIVFVVIIVRLPKSKL